RRVLGALSNLHEKRGDTQLRIDVVRIELPVRDVLALHVLIRSSPEIGRWQALVAVAEAVVCFEGIERGSKAPILALRQKRAAIHQGVDRGFFPRLERPPPLGNDGGFLPRSNDLLAVVENARKIAGAFPVMNDADHVPRYTSLC